ncbi:MAG: hypothetical protein JRJ65_10295 [Deltaproteobacteria bacterium]|nr:hypothetical protein [Deltaproteobacteria bacterium]
MPISVDEFHDIEIRNEERKALRPNVSKGHWKYESFAFIEVDSEPNMDRSCILVRRRSWFERLIKKYGRKILDEETAEENKNHAVQSEHDGLYIVKALNDSIEEDVAQLISEIRRLRDDLPPPPRIKSGIRHDGWQAGRP